MQLFMRAISLGPVRTQVAKLFNDHKNAKPNEQYWWRGREARREWIRALGKEFFSKRLYEADLDPDVAANQEECLRAMQQFRELLGDQVNFANRGHESPAAATQFGNALLLFEGLLVDAVAEVEGITLDGIMHGSETSGLHEFVAQIYAAKSASTEWSPTLKQFTGVSPHAHTLLISTST